MTTLLTGLPQPLLIAVSVTVIFPVSLKICAGFCSDEVVLSPKSHNQVTLVGVAVPRKFTASEAQTSVLSKVKSTKGGVPVDTAFGMVSVSVQPPAVVIVRVRV